MSTNITTKDSVVLPIMVPVKNSLRTVNFYLIKENNALILLDAGYDNDACWEALQQTLMDNDLHTSDIDCIILTHHHIDHIGLVNRVLDRHYIPVYAHRKSLPRLKRDPSFLMMRVDFYEKLYNEMGCGDASKQYIQRIKRFAKDPNGFTINGEVTPLSEKINGFKALETPGHAVDHIAFLDWERKWLFAGDLLLSRTSSNALVEPDENMERLPTLVQYRESLMLCATLDVNITFPGHQRLIYDHRALIETRLKRMDEKASKLVDLIKQGVTTASDMAKLFYKEKYKKQFPLVMSEIIGHLDYLELKGKIFSRLRYDIRHYFVE